MEGITRIEERIADTKGYLNELESVLPGTVEAYKSAGLMLKRTVERDMQLINDSEIDVLALLVKIKEISIAPSEEALIDRFDKLLSRKIINHLKEFRRLRNILTHTYKNENYDESVFNSAQKLGDVRLFIKEIERIAQGRA